MAQTKRLATQAVIRGESALRIYSDVTRTGHIPAGERAALGRALDSWFVVSRAADASQALGHALERGIGDVAYLQSLVTGYQRLIDELPEEAA